MGPSPAPNSTLEPRGPFRRYNAKGACKACGAKSSVLAAQTGASTETLSRVVSRVWVGGKWTQLAVTETGALHELANGGLVLTCKCGLERLALPVRGKVNAG